MAFEYVTLVRVYCVYNVSNRGLSRTLSNIYDFLFLVFLENR